MYATGGQKFYDEMQELFARLREASEKALRGEEGNREPAGG
jgi:hypothetical protein